MTEAGRASGVDPGLRRGLVIAIDGPVGAGKSTVARLLAESLGCVHIDSGAMYRALGWKAVRFGVDLHDHLRLGGLAATTDIRIVPGARGARVVVDGEDVTASLRTPTVDEAASLVSTCPAVRERTVTLQRAMAQAGGVVMDGRDIGTVVFPNAHLKFFLDADLSVRARSGASKTCRTRASRRTRAPFARTSLGAMLATARATWRRCVRPPTPFGLTRLSSAPRRLSTSCWPR